MKQTWRDLLFAHWPIPAAVMRTLVPPELELHTFDRECWVAVTPFHMTGIHGRDLPPVPGFSAFAELNVRTYVSYEDKPGVYFFSLDDANRAAAWAARQFYRLPYFHAKMKVEIKGERVGYFSRRGQGNPEFRGRYRPVGEVQLRERGSLAHWLTERYCLYTVAHGRVYRGEIHHVRWPLQDAEAEIVSNTMGAAAGIKLPATAPLLHFARCLEVLIWPLRRA